MIMSGLEERSRIEATNIYDSMMELLQIEPAVLRKDFEFIEGLRIKDKSILHSEHDLAINHIPKTKYVKVIFPRIEDFIYGTPDFFSKDDPIVFGFGDITYVTKDSIEVYEMAYRQAPFSPKESHYTYRIDAPEKIHKIVEKISRELISNHKYHAVCDSTMEDGWD